jgi:hypothetical protein
MTSSYAHSGQGTIGWYDARMDLPSLTSLKSTGAVPHYFGLGFIQLKLDHERRLHFWTPDWSTIPGNDTEIHNHRYALASTVLKGALDQVVYAMGKLHSAPVEGALEVVEVSCQPGDDQPPVLIGYATPEALVAHRIETGRSYTLLPDDFHIANAVGDTITLVMRGPVVHEKARVLRPLDSGFTCPFSIEKTTQECWDRIEKMLG